MSSKKRKDDHIQLAKAAQWRAESTEILPEFLHYEPCFGTHPRVEEVSSSVVAMGKWKFSFPLWISSMTGGAKHALAINELLARATREFQLGMGLGSCRPVLEAWSRPAVRKSVAKDFLWRKVVGDERPLFANLGLAQVEELVVKKKLNQLRQLIDFLECDGLCLHLNALQEWAQPEGDRWEVSPLVTIKRLIDELGADTRISVKEVGQGMGLKSLTALGQLPLWSVEFGALGGTNFTLLESMRRSTETAAKDGPLDEVASWGHDARQMCTWVQQLLENKKFAPRVIISGGVRSFTPYFGWLRRWQQFYQAEGAVGVGFPVLERARKGEKALYGYLEQVRQLYLLHEKFLKIQGG